MSLMQVLAMCDKYHVRLAGEVYALYLKTQLRFSNSSRELDDLLQTLKRLKAQGEDWTLLLDAGHRFALCAVLNKHMQHALLLQTVRPWLSMKVCVQLLGHIRPSAISLTCSNISSLCTVQACKQGSF